MTILVFGKTGQVGRELISPVSILSLGREVADLSDPAGCAAKIHELRPDVVINAAAYTAVDRAEEEPELAHVINAEAPGAMAVACAELKIPFLHVSTDYVFAGSGNEPWAVADTPNPIGVYGRSKLAGEVAVVAARGNHAILRTSWVFSAHGANFVKTMLRLAATRDEISVVADQIGGPTAAADIAATLRVMAGRFLDGQVARGIYHFSGSPNVSWADFAREIFRQAGLTTRVIDITSEQYPTPAKRPLNSRLDCEDLARDFWVEQPDWRQSLGRVLVTLGHQPVNKPDR